MKKILFLLMFMTVAHSLSARYYDPEMGRFANRDKLEYVDGMNLYAGYFAQHFAVDPEGEKFLMPVSSSPTKIKVKSWKRAGGIKFIETTLAWGTASPSQKFPEFEGNSVCCSVVGEYVMTVKVKIAVGFRAQEGGPITPRTIPAIANTAYHEMRHAFFYKARVHDKYDPKFKFYIGKEWKGLDCIRVKNELTLLKLFAGADLKAEGQWQGMHYDFAGEAPPVINMDGEEAPGRGRRIRYPAAPAGPRPRSNF